MVAGLSGPFLGLDMAHGGELALRLLRIDNHHNESVAREIAFAVAILLTAE
jgi:hypothetical protein